MEVYPIIDQQNRPWPETLMINPPPPVRVKNPAVPPEVEEVLLTALAKEPQQRFATVQAFSNALWQASKIVYPIASASTISFKEASDLPSIGTQPISGGMPPATDEYTR
jgi:hypothetical protein